MSRCFPYPLPGHVRNAVPVEALIDSIKIQKGSEKSKVEKKEKRKEKKRNEQLSKIGYATSHIPVDKKALYGENCNGDPYLVKGNEVEAEQLENSGITEEYEQPGNSQMSCYLSDSTLSNKRKRHESPSTSSNGSQPSCSRTHGNVLCIRLSSPDQREPDALLSKEQRCSTSGRVKCVSQQNVPNQQLYDNSKTDMKKVTPRSTAGDEKSFAASRSKSHKDEKRWMKLCDKMDTFLPLSLQIEKSDCDDQWLFETKLGGRHIPKRCRADINGGLIRNEGATFSLWPSTHYLPQADIHVLPYTIPF